MKIKFILSSLFVTSVLMGCNSNDAMIEKYTSASKSDGTFVNLPIKTVFSNLSTPESVTLNGNKQYISNIGGNPGESNGLGFINLGNNTYINNLDDPKGMAIIDDGHHAILSDHPNVKLINLDTAEVVQTLPIMSAGFLNDAVALSSTSALISDTGTGDVYQIKLLNGNITYSKFITASELNGNGVNGLLFDKETSILYLVTSTFGGNLAQGHIYQTMLNETSERTGNIEQWSIDILGNGNLDGMALKNGKLMISDWENDDSSSSIFIFDINTKEQVYKISGNFNSPADIALDQDTNILYIPEFNENIVSSINMSDLIN
ncbi:hypothetical protein ACU5EH_23395 [Aliivibrio salmonicida]|uniref:hypothetical protein n=1 Tax=Aliivibrio TaxID=511678 RepID=UPI00406CA7D7